MQGAKEELKSMHEGLAPSDPLYGKFDAVLARCIEKFDDTQKQSERSLHDLGVLRKFLEGCEKFKNISWGMGFVIEFVTEYVCTILRAES